MFTKKQLLEAYDRVVGGYPEYRRMIRKMVRMVNGRVLEVGAGTGLLTEQLLKNDAITKLVLAEPDVSFIKKLNKKFPHIKVLRKNGITFQPKKKFGCIVMSLVYHHIPDAQKESFLRNTRRSLRKGGTLVIGDVFLFPYRNEQKRDRSLRVFHEARIKQAKDNIVREVERQALKDGLKRSGEYKISVEMLAKQLRIVGFKNIAIADIGSQSAGGYKIVTSRINR